MSGLVGHFQLMAGYNRLANEALYAACAKLDDAEYRQPRAAFFGSIHATLNHLLVGDRIWFGRYQAAPVSIALDAELYSDFAELHAARIAEDARIERFTAGLDEVRLGAPFEWTNSRGQHNSWILSPLLTHTFNHQTHHRGQVHAMLSGTSVPPPPLDLIYLVPR